MFLRKFKTPGLAHVAYLLADGGDAALVDPRRDVSAYLDVVQEQGFRLVYVIETHRQEDFVVGSAEVARLTGAKVVSLAHELFGHSDVRVKDGEQLPLGSLTLRALHTPGHTPESTCYAVFTREAPNKALGVFTGDTLFVGEAGRTDLPDPRKTGLHAGQLFDSVHQKLVPLGEQAILWPAHGAGSVCGGNIADRDESTLGLERSYNPVFTLGRDEFIAAKVEERIPRPPYFTHMEQVNLHGGLPMPKVATSLPLFSPRVFSSEIKRGLVIDTRQPEAFASGHIPGSVNIWLQGLPVFAGWFADAPRVYLVVEQMTDLADAFLHLARIGIDSVEGALAEGFKAWKDAGLPLAYNKTIDVERLHAVLDDSLVLDVRQDSEFEASHIRQARHLFVGYLDEHITRIKSELDSKRNIVVTCSVGHRAGLATSILQRHGYDNVFNLLGGMKAWASLEFPVTSGAEHSVTTPSVEGVRA